MAKFNSKSRLAHLTDLFCRLYKLRFLRPVILRILNRYDGGSMHSAVWRSILKRNYGVTVGKLTMGAPLKPGVLPRGTIIGNFTCIASGLLIFRRNHTHQRFSQHAVFYNADLGAVQNDQIESNEDNPLRIGSDVWLGANVIVCPGCKEIGDGAIVGAGTVLTKSVAPFTIVGGNPGKLIRPRFSPHVESVIRNSQWWDRPMDEIFRHFELFTGDIDDGLLTRFAKAFGVENSLVPDSLSQDSNQARSQ